MLLWNVALALVWAAMTGEISMRNLVLGYALGYVVLTLSRRAMDSADYIVKVRKAAFLVAYFIWDLVRANVRLAYRHVIAPVPRFYPGIIAYPLEGETDGEIVVLANVITLIPGTLSLHVSRDKRTLYIYTLYTDDIDGVRREIKERYERRLLELIR